MAKHRKRISKDIPAKGRLKDFADRLWSLAVRDDWNHRCAVCGAGNCDAHHLLPRQHEATRYDLRNGIALCPRHHQFDADISPHQNAAGWMQWLLENHPLRHQWYVDMIDSGSFKSFDGTKNAQYYIGTILRLKAYVPDGTFLSIVGVRFHEYLLKCEKPG